MLNQIYKYRLIILGLSTVLLLAVLFTPIPHYEKVSEKINYPINEIDDPKYDSGVTVGTQAGKDGEAIVTYKSNYSLFDSLLNKDRSRHEVSKRSVVEPVPAIVSKGTKPAATTPASTQATATQQRKPTQQAASVNCSDEYYKNTKTYQEFWRSQIDSAHNDIKRIHSYQELTADQKREQSNQRAQIFNNYVKELVGIWQQAMNSSGCGSTPLGFDPGYIPIE